MSKVFVFFCILFPVCVLAETQRHEASVEIDLSDLRSLLVLIDQQMGWHLDLDELVYFSEGVDINYQVDLTIDVQYRGTVQGVSYRTKVDEGGNVDFRLASDSEQLIKDVQNVMKQFVERQRN